MIEGEYIRIGRHRAEVERDCALYRGYFAGFEKRLSI